jgi:hypothetical protein
MANIEYLIYLLRGFVSNTIMSEQTSMQILSTWQPIVVLEKLEEEFPEWREIVVSAMCLCADKRIVSSYAENLYGPKNKFFPGSFCYISFSVVSNFKYDFLNAYDLIYLVHFVTLRCSFLVYWCGVE